MADLLCNLSVSSYPSSSEALSLRINVSNLNYDIINDNSPLVLAGYRLSTTSPTYVSISAVNEMDMIDATLRRFQGALALFDRTNGNILHSLAAITCGGGVGTINSVLANSGYYSINNTSVTIPIYTETTIVNNVTFINAGNLKSVYNNQTEQYLTTFPSTMQVANGNSLSVQGVDNQYNLTLNNGQNMKSIKDGNTEYSNFPVTIPISANKTLNLNGEDDKVITVNYNNTSEPIVTNT